MQDERWARLLLRVAVVAFGAVLIAAAIVPADAWSPAPAALTGAPELVSPRVLDVRTGLTAAPEPGGVMVSTGDGGGAGSILGIDGTVHVREATFRGAPCWEIGSATVATYVDGNGVRLDDGMTDRLAVRAWPIPVLAAIAALASWLGGSRGNGRLGRAAGPILLLGVLALLISW